MEKACREFVRKTVKPGSCMYSANIIEAYQMALGAC